MLHQEKERIQLAQQGDHEALSLLLQEHYRFLKKYLLKITLHEHDTDDLVQETMLKAMLHIKSYHEKSKFSSWLITIATRLYIDKERKRKREHDYLTNQKHLAKQLTWQLTKQRRERAAATVHALSFVSSEVRVMMILKYVYGYRYLDIAELMSIPEGTVKSKIFTGLQKLREELKRTDES